MDRSGNKDDRQAAALLRKHRDGTLTPQERAALDGWYLHRARTAEPLRDPEVYARRIQELDEAFPFTRPAPVKRLTRWLPYAAAAAILLAVGWLLLVDSRESAVSLAATEILPGGNRATLTLADGRTIDLSTEQTGITVSDEDITYDDGISSVVMLSAKEASVNMLALTTPKGGTYQITLPDGSRVWLNSNSTLKYPSRFSGEERVVELTGEAFFEIRPQAGKVGANKYSPFNVQTANQVVHVLGTQFNLSAYPDDPETQTTLVTGKVRVGVSPAGGGSDGLRDGRGRSFELTPGQQSITRGLTIEIRQVDTEQYASWKDGYFQLSGTIPEILKRIGRWYDVEVVYEGQPGHRIEVAASIPRDVALGDILQALQEYDAGLTYKLTKTNDGRRLTLYR